MFEIPEVKVLHPRPTADETRRRLLEAIVALAPDEARKLEAAE
jgi:hypothetical protein